MHRACKAANIKITSCRNFFYNKVFPDASVFLEYQYLISFNIDFTLTAEHDLNETVIKYCRGTLK